MYIWMKLKFNDYSNRIKLMKGQLMCIASCKIYITEFSQTVQTNFYCIESSWGAAV